MDKMLKAPLVVALIALLGTTFSVRYALAHGDEEAICAAADAKLTHAVAVCTATQRDCDDAGALCKFAAAQCAEDKEQPCPACTLSCPPTPPVCPTRCKVVTRHHVRGVACSHRHCCTFQPLP